jgi:hypothetical protein
VIDATPLLRLYARRRQARLAGMDPVAEQERQLAALLARARDTAFGRAHDFARLRTVADFQQAVPLRRYEDFWREWWQPAFPVLADVGWPGRIPYLATTSGTTTGVSKYVPVSPAMVRANRRAALDLLVHHLVNRPQSHILGGRNFMLGGTADLTRQAPGVLSGDLSGIVVNEVPAWAKPRYFPPRDLALIADWEAKVADLAPRSLREDIRSISGTPSWLLLFFDRLAALRPDRPPVLASWYPRLEMIAHGGVAFAPYRRRFAQLLKGSQAELREVYPTSEGFIAVADRGPGEGLRMMVDNGLFLELVPVAEIGAASPTRHWLATMETGIDYALVLSSCAGLWSYVLGDTVRVVDRRPPRLVVTGRTSYFLSAFGERVDGEEIETAVTEAADAVGVAVTDYAMGPVYPAGPGERGGHLFVVEPDRPLSPAERERFLAVLDATLARLNLDYRDHRAGDFGMAPPALLTAPAGGFAAWMKSQGKLGGQHKVPRVIADEGKLRGLAAFMENVAGRPATQ